MLDAGESTRSQYSPETLLSGLSPKTSPKALEDDHCTCILKGRPADSSRMLSRAFIRCDCKPAGDMSQAAHFLLHARSHVRKQRATSLLSAGPGQCVLSTSEGSLPAPLTTCRVWITEGLQGALWPLCGDLYPGAVIPSRLLWIKVELMHVLWLLLV